MNDKPRRPPNLTEKVEVLTAQAFCACSRCRAWFDALLKQYGCPERLVAGAVEYHHIDERAAGGADHPHNYFAVTAECHMIETNKAGGSKAKVAKARRLKRAREALALAELPREEREAHKRIFADANRPMLPVRRKRKIQSRGFDKGKRKFR